MFDIIIKSLCAFSIMCFFWSQTALAKSIKPNVVFILVDDLRYDTIGNNGHAFIKTPGIDQLAKEGISFDRAFVTTSLCSPSRASFLTGLHAHTHGVPGNTKKDPLEKYPTLAQYMQKAGYETAHIGKWHMAKHANPRKGYDHWVSFKGQGFYGKNILNVDGKTEVSEKYITDELTERAIKFIKKKRARPFFLWIGHKAIHAPFTPANRHRSLYKDRKIPTVDSASSGSSIKVEWGRKVPSNYKKIVRDYYQSISAIDESVTRIIDTLNELNILDDTVIIFTSDNGYLHGEHGGLWDKRAAYEESIRIPFIVRYPKLIPNNSRSDEMILNIDLLPTFLDWLDIKSEQQVHGKSWYSIISRTNNGKRFSRNSFLYEYFREDDDKYDRPSVLSVRTADYKLITYPHRNGAPIELYHLGKDPREASNLAYDSKYREIKDKLLVELEMLKRERNFKWPKNLLIN